MTHFVGDIGTVFRAQIRDEKGAVAVTGGSVSFLWRAPDGTLDTHSATIEDADYARGALVTYTTTSGDLDQAGTWEWQVKFTDASSNVWSSDIKTFQVNAVLS